MKNIGVHRRRKARGIENGAAIPRIEKPGLQSRFRRERPIQVQRMVDDRRSIAEQPRSEDDAPIAFGMADSVLLIEESD